VLYISYAFSAYSKDIPTWGTMIVGPCLLTTYGKMCCKQCHIITTQIRLFFLNFMHNHVTWYDIDSGIVFSSLFLPWWSLVCRRRDLWCWMIALKIYVQTDRFQPLLDYLLSRMGKRWIAAKRRRRGNDRRRWHNNWINNCRWEKTRCLLADVPEANRRWLHVLFWSLLAEPLNGWVEARRKWLRALFLWDWCMDTCQQFEASCRVVCVQSAVGNFLPSNGRAKSRSHSGNLCRSFFSQSSFLFSSRYVHTWRSRIQVYIRAIRPGSVQAQKNLTRLN
jgi:hypothetical protein